MALFKYVKKADCGNDSASVLEAKVAGDKEEVSEVKKAKRGEQAILRGQDIYWQVCVWKWCVQGFGPV